MTNKNITVEIVKIYKRKNDYGYIQAVVLGYKVNLGEVIYCYMTKPEEIRASYTYAFLQTFQLAEGGYDLEC